MDLVYFDLDEREKENEKTSFLGCPVDTYGLYELLLEAQEKGFARTAYEEAEKIFLGEKENA